MSPELKDRASSESLNLSTFLIIDYTKTEGDLTTQLPKLHNYRLSPHVDTVLRRIETGTHQSRVEDTSPDHRSPGALLHLPSEFSTSFTFRESGNERLF